MVLKIFKMNLYFLTFFAVFAVFAGTVHSYTNLNCSFETTVNLENFSKHLIALNEIEESEILLRNGQSQNVVSRTEGGSGILVENGRSQNVVSRTESGSGIVVENGRSQNVVSRNGGRSEIVFGKGSSQNVPSRTGGGSEILFGKGSSQNVPSPNGPSPNDLSSFFASHYLDIQKLLGKREEYLTSKLSKENVLDYYTMSSELGFKNLKQKCENLFRTENKNIFENKKISGLNFDNLRNILREVQIGNEGDNDLKEKIFRFMMSWIKKDSQNREILLPNLFKIVPLDGLSQSFLEEHVLSDSLFARFPRILELLKKLLNRAHSRQTSTNIGLRPGSDSHVYLLGGETGAGLETVSSVSQLDTANHKYKKLPPMIIPRHSFGATVINGKIYACGGLTLGGGLARQLEVYDKRSNTWTELAPMEHGRSNFGMSALNGEIYVVGGWYGNGGLSAVLKYSPETNKWTNVA